MHACIHYLKTCTLDSELNLDAQLEKLDAQMILVWYLYDSMAYYFSILLLNRHILILVILEIW